MDILLALSSKKQETIISFFGEKKKQEIIRLLDLSKTPISRFITLEYITVNSEMLTHEVVNIIRTKTSDFSFLEYVYVLNGKDQLVGVFNLHELLLQPNDVPVNKFMTQNVIIVHLTTPEEIAVKKILKYHLNALPVIDVNKKILGIIALDNVDDFLLKKWTQYP